MNQAARKWGLATFLQNYKDANSATVVEDSAVAMAAAQSAIFPHFEN